VEQKVWDVGIAFENCTRVEVRQSVRSWATGSLLSAQRHVKQCLVKGRSLFDYWCGRAEIMEARIWILKSREAFELYERTKINFDQVSWNLVESFYRLKNGWFLKVKASGQRPRSNPHRTIRLHFLVRLKPLYDRQMLKLLQRR
jgi:hypothetical protein